MNQFDQPYFGAGEPGDFPWNRSPSVYEHIRLHVRPGEPGLAKGGEVLPDEDRFGGESTFDGRREPFSDDDCRRLVTLLRSFWTAPTVLNKADLYAFVVDRGMTGVDPNAVSDWLFRQEDVDDQRLYELARSFATEAPDREPVKLGIAVLGHYGVPQVFEILKTLGRHDEFTCSCAWALSKAADEGEHELWELARNVEGCNRDDAVQRLATTSVPEIREWILREGFRNSGGDEYLAYTCATTGGCCPPCPATMWTRSS
jgi:hypothetical protein